MAAVRVGQPPKLDLAGCEPGKGNMDEYNIIVMASKNQG